MMRELNDRTGSGLQHVGRQEDPYDSETPTMSAESSGLRSLSVLGCEDEHRTGPHHLVESWSSLAALLRAACVEPDRDYVMKAEERPSLCLYPKDEKFDEWDDAQAGGLAGFASSGGRVPDNALSVSQEYWGNDYSEGRPEDNRARPQRYVVERLALWDADTVEAFYKSYMEHVHIMQPFLDKGETRSLLDDFIAWHGVTSQPSIAADVRDTTSARPPKRRRHDNHSDVRPLYQPRRRYLLGDAVVYLILALGEICMHSDPLPADSPAIKRSGTFSGSPGHMYEAESLSPSLNSADIMPRVGSQTPSAGRRSLGNDSPATRKTPGLDYYVKAIEIFGAQSDSNDLVHAHLFLLAGLYKGQLARVKESMSWYAMAGRVLRQLLRSHGLKDKDHWAWTSGGGKALKERSQKFITDKYRSSIVRASCSCIQLESDILAELDLPSSGIASMETVLPMPDAFPHVSGEREELSHPANILFHFTSQVYLRSRLNQIHGQLYGSDCEGLSLPEIRCILRGHETTISAWQESLPADMSWDLEDLPPTNILQARLRAKYWGARYLINRPFLDYILNIKPHPRFGADRTVSNSHGKPRHEAEFHLFRAISEMSVEEVQIGYQTCIKAAEKSTTAFDSVLGRLIVTNIHGTAHA
jgi:hypothetical protein